MEATTTHKFQRAGLGSPPYRYCGNTRETYQAVPGDPNCPILPGASCDYCSTAICDAYWFESADGNRFKVGSTCVYKAGDAGMRRAIAPTLKRAKEERENVRIARALGILSTDGPVTRKLDADPHGHSWRAEKGETRRDQLLWLLENAGRRGKMEAVRAVEKLAKRVQS